VGEVSFGVGEQTIVRTIETQIINMTIETQIINMERTVNGVGRGYRENALCVLITII